MRLSVRVVAPLARLAAAARAAAAGRRAAGDQGTARAGLPSTSNIRDPETLADPWQIDGSDGGGVPA